MSCPDLQQLEQYLSREDDDAARRAVAAHVAVCDDCSSRLSGIHENRRIEVSLRELLGAPSARSEPCLPAEIGAYRLLRELGRGGMGVVYEAEQRDPPRRVAVKLLSHRRGANGGAERLLRREAQALARLRHASIAAIYEAGKMHDGRPFFAMELVEGQPLTAYAQRRNLTLRARLELFARICDSVAYAHQRGVIHRDLKPSNVLIEPDGTPKVLDFGLARILEPDAEGSGFSVHGSESVVEAPVSSVIEPGRIFGTLPYMSPEHLRGDPHEIDVRSDVYSLGVMLYELLTGRLPYPVDRSNVAQLVRVICEAPSAPPGAAMRELRGDVETIVLKALEKQPERRYASAGELAQDIRRHLKNEPIAARPPSAIYQLRKFAARNRALVASIAVSAVALLVATGAAFNQAVAATRERDLAQRRLDWARHSADYLFFGLNGQIARVPGTGHILRHLAEEAYVFYRRIADENPQDPTQQEGLWAATQRLVMLALEDRNQQRAQVLTDEVRARVEAAAARHPDDPRVMRELMQVHNTLASVAAAVGDAAAAEQHRARAFELCRQVAEWHEQHTDFSDPSVWEIPDQGPSAGRQPEHLVARGNWARALAGAAERSLASDDPDTAEQQYREALQILDELMPNDRTLDPIYRRDISEYAALAGPILLRVGSRAGYETTRAGILIGLGHVALRRDDVKEAEQQFGAAVEVVERLATDVADAPVPEDITVSAALLSVHTQMARFRQRGGDLAAARTHAREALIAAQRLADGDRQHVGWQQPLAAAQALVEELRVSR